MAYSKNVLILTAELTVVTHNLLLLEEQLDCVVQQGHVRAFSTLYKQRTALLQREDNLLELIAEEVSTRSTKLGLVPYIQ